MVEIRRTQPISGVARIDRQTWLRLAFYLGVPIVTAIYGGLNNWQLIEVAGYFAGLGFYTAHALLPWGATCAMTSLAMYGLRRLKPPPYVLMAIGSFVAACITLPYTNWLTSTWQAQWPMDQMHQQIAPLFSAEFWRYLTRATIIWFLVNFIFDRFLGLPRYRYEIPRGYNFDDSGDPHRLVETSPTDGNAEKVPGFLERIPNTIGRQEVLAIKAEQHYIRVYTPDREYLLLYRFSDAVRELGTDSGQQVHRSYWVNTAAIDYIKPRAKKFKIRLINGVEIPVSTPYHMVVKELARANGIVIRA